MIRKTFWLCLPLILSLLGLGALFKLVKAMPSASVTGKVISPDGNPISGATVRLQATTNSTTSDLDGSFSLGGLTEGISVTVSAWKDNYYCAKVETVTPPANNITLTLRLYQTDDNPSYEWILPTGTNSCYSCKPGVTQIWLDNDAHGRSGNNPRFFSLYNGSDISGTNVITPGYKTDFPDTAGNCATCHAPSAALDMPYTTDMNTLADIDRDFGIHCDFCHKVADVYLNASTGLPYPNAPGVLSLDIRRPFPESERSQLFFGTFDDDNVPLEDTYLPLIKKSQWCATCHQFSFWGTPIYQSFKEWLESPYSAMGVECQTCHMPSDGVMTNVAPGMGGVERDPSAIHAHSMPGAASQTLLQNTVAMSLKTQVNISEIEAYVTITNVMAGHDVPTDHPGRHMILTLQATDSNGMSLPQTSGAVVPFWGGAQSSLPGKAYAKVLQDALSGEYPVVSYWKQTYIRSDNRISAFASDRSEYGFLAPQAGGTITVTAELRFRRNFQDEMDKRGWDVPDILMATQQMTITLPTYTMIYIPYLAIP